MEASRRRPGGRRLLEAPQTKQGYEGVFADDSFFSSTQGIL